ncbi:palmitoyltransferase ZDHHC23 isoform X2 [Hyalella azteca]|uniref:Palmitoyltransferase n=1 Tax=Hyalella azteca TaxID=294128 RepID=A0A979FS88_HYAAZ|nr:palmitoyltransferase ZDHHC23 isoform X2 [Hyalella azteca]
MQLDPQKCIRCSPIESSLVERLHSTVADRLRVPWPSGAIKVPASVAFSVALMPCFMLLAAISLTATLITYCLLLPCVVYTVHRHIKDIAVSRDPQLLSKQTRHRSKFYISFLLSSLFWCYFFFMTQVMNHLEINAIESLVLHALCGTSLACLYITRDRSAPRLSPPAAAEVDVIESGNAWRLCDECVKQVPAFASHCRTCNACFLHRDHHCLWLDCCISSSNDRWFVCSVAVGGTALLYAALLALSVVCRPYVLRHSSLLPLPHLCIYVYATWKSGLSTSTACLLLMLFTASWLLLVQQVVCIARGVRLRQWKRSRDTSRLTLAKVMQNCFNFWFRWSSPPVTRRSC